MKVTIAKLNPEMKATTIIENIPKSLILLYILYGKTYNVLRTFSFHIDGGLTCNKTQPLNEKPHHLRYFPLPLLT